MKKILFLIALVCGVSYGVNAQVWGSQTMTYSVSGDDTATDADEILLKAPNGLQGNYDVTVQLLMTRITGTLAGTSYCRGSVDGTTWYTLAVDANVSPSITDTATFTNAATNTKTFVYRNVPFRYFELVANTTGTVTAAPTAVLYYRKRD